LTGTMDNNRTERNPFITCTLQRQIDVQGYNTAFVLFHVYWI